MTTRRVFSTAAGYHALSRARMTFQQQGWTPACSNAFQFSSSGGFKSNSKKSRPDPFARRPNEKCDPYGQGGKPLTVGEARRLLATVHPGWILMGNDGEVGDDSDEFPTQLTKVFSHRDFMSGAAFLNHVAAVAQMNDHYPALRLERKLDSRQKQWVVISTVTCHTFVLQGLSHHDFFVATLIDVETERTEVRSLLFQEESLTSS